MGEHKKYGRNSRHRRGELGNVFFTLFGAVAVVGVLGAGIMATMRGPLSTMVEVNRREQAKSELQVAASLVLSVATDDYVEDTCEGGGPAAVDGYTEGPPPTAGTGPTGGGLMPSVGATQTDPWGNAYGYCVWDHGPDAAGSDGGCTGYLAGTTSTNREAIAVISAGPNGVFDTTCGADPTYISPTGGGADDIVVSKTYDQAITGSGGLWNLKSGDPNVAEINKNLEVTGSATFTDVLDLTGSPSAQLQLGAASLLLPNQITTPNTDCNGANAGMLRFNTIGGSVEVCDGTNFVNSGSYFNTNANGIDYGGGNVGIGVALPNDALDVAGSAQITGATALDGAVTAGSTLGVTGATTLTGSLTANSTSAFNDSVVITSTATDTTPVLTINQSGPSEILRVQSDGNVGIGDTSPNDALDVSGAIDLTETLKIDGINVVNNGTGTDTILLGQDAGADVTGDNNTIVGAGAASTLTTGTGNIVIGQGSDVALPATSDNLIIGTLLQGDLANDRLGIGFPAGTDVSLFNDALEVNGNGDFSGALNVTGTSTFGDNMSITGDTSDGSTNPLSIEDSSASVVFTVDSNGRVDASDFFIDGTKDLDPGGTCGAGNFSRWDGNSWQCDADGTGGGDGVGGDGLPEVLANDPSANNIAITDVADPSNAQDAATKNYVDTQLGSLSSDRIEDNDGNTYIDVDTAGDGSANTTIFQNAGAESARIDATGNLGLGTTTPTNKLTILDGNIAIREDDDGNNAVIMGAGLDVGWLALHNAGVLNTYINSAVGAPSYFNAGGVVFGDTTIDASAYVEMESTSRGFLTPRMTVAQRDAIAAPATGLLVFATDAGDGGLFQFYDGGTWVDVGAGGATGAGLWTEDGTNNYIEYDDTLGGVRIGRVTGQPAPNTDWELDTANSVVYTTANTLAIGSGTVSGALQVDVTGAVGAAQYCDADGNNCFTAATVAGGGSGLWTDDGTYISYDNAHILDTGAALDAALDDNGKRFFYYENKSALRGGEIVGGNAAWQDANIGLNSVAWGLNPRAIGYASTAFGDVPQATGQRTVAMGYHPIASGDYSTAIGRDVTSSGYGSTALGFDARAGDGTGSDGTAPGTGLGDYSIALGAGNSSGAVPQVTGDSSLGIFMGDQSGVDVTSSNTMSVLGGNFVVGSPLLDDEGSGTYDNRMFFNPTKGAFRAGLTTTSTWNDANVGTGSIGLGRGTTASNTGSIAIGNFTTSSGQDSLALGYDVITSGQRSIAIAAGNTSGSPNPTVSADEAIGIFMANQNSVDLATTRTMLIAGGSVIIDPASPATQVVPRTALDVGAATDAFFMPVGTMAQRPATPLDGMFRFNSENDAYEVYSATATDWIEIVADGALASNVAGNDTEVQFNDSGSPGADPGLTYDQTTDTLNVASVINVGDKINIAGVAGAAPSFANLDDLDDVSTAGPTDGYLLSYNSGSGNWVAIDPATLSASIPDRIQDTGDANTYIDVDTDDADSNNTISLATAGTERMHFDAAGLIGIGTNNPSDMLHIFGNNPDLRLDANSAGGNSPAVRYAYDGTTEATILLSSPGDDDMEFNIDMGNDGVGDYEFKINSTTEVIINNAGNMGVGTTSPGLSLASQALTVSDTSASGTAALELQGNITGADASVSAIGFYNDATPIASIVARRINADNSGSMIFNTTDAGVEGERMRITRSGNVGIGTNSPSNRLEVVDTQASPVNALVANASTDAAASATVVAGTDAGIVGIGTTTIAGGAVSYLAANTAGGLGINSEDATNSRIVLQTGVTATPRMIVDHTGLVGIGTLTPQTLLDLNGTLKIADGGEACDANREGAIRYDGAGDVFYFCATAASGWEAISLGSGVTELDDLSDAYHDIATDFDGDTNDNDDNLALGHTYTALDGTTPGARNTAIGATALDGVTTGDNNIAVGYDAGTATTAGSNNVLMGRASGAANTAGNNNVYIGDLAGTSNDSSANTVVGYQAGQNMTGGTNNTYFGYQAGVTNVSGDSNIMIGIGTNAPTGTTNDWLNIGDAIEADMASREVFIDAPAAAPADGDLNNGAWTLWLDEVNNEFELKAKKADGTVITQTVGSSAGAIAINDLSDAEKDTTNNNLFMAEVYGSALTNNTQNTGVGIGALDALTNSAGAGEGDDNTAFGFNALTDLTTGSSNVAFGSAAGGDITTATDNTAIGVNAGRFLTSGSRNVAIGRAAGSFNETGNNNITIGVNAGQGTSSSSDIADNIIIGFSSAIGIQTGANLNTIMGHSAATALTDGTSNTLIGQNTGDTLTTGDFNIMIGAGADVSAATASNELNIGDVITGDLANSVVRVEHGAGFPEFQLTSNNTTLPDYSGSASVGTVANSNIFGRLTNNLGSLGGVTTGGMLVQGFTNSAENAGFPLDISGSHGGTAPTTPAVRITGQKHNGTDNRAGLADNEIIMDVANGYDNATPLVRIMGDGDIGIGTATPQGTLHIDSDNPDLILDVNSTAPTFPSIQFRQDGTLQSEIEWTNNANEYLAISLDSDGDGNSGLLINGGPVGIGAAPADASALMALTSTTQGFLPPRMTTTERDNIATPATGLHVYNTTTNTYDYYNGATWVSYATSAGTDNDWQVDVGNSYVFNTTDDIGIGTATPQSNLHLGAAGSQLRISSDGNNTAIIIDDMDTANRTSNIDFQTGAGGVRARISAHTGDSGTDNELVFSTSNTVARMMTMNSDNQDGTALGLEYTVNKGTGTGDDWGVLIRKTDTASPGVSRLIEGQTDTTPQFWVDDAGYGYFRGEVGIGTASPAGSLHVVGDNRDMYLDSINGTDSSYGPDLQLRRSRAGAIVVDNDKLGGVRFFGHDGVDYRTAGTILVEVDGTPGAGDMPARMVFNVSEDGELVGDGTPEMVIKNSGFVGIGTETPSGVLDVEGSTFFLPGDAAAPADASFANSQWTLWLDETNDEFELKAKKADGSIITQTVGTSAGAIAISDLTDAINDTTTNFDGDANDNDDNIALGHKFATLDAGTPGARNTAIGTTALDAITTGDGNIGIGYDAGTAITSGTRNTLLGKDTGLALITQTGNTFLGWQAGRGSTGNNNIAIGSQTMNSAVTGDENVFVGQGAGQNASGNVGTNVAVGYQAGLNLSGPAANSNVLIGWNSGATMTDSIRNTAIGYNALSTATTDARENTVLGYFSGTTITTGDNNILIGNAVNTTSATASNELNIGDLIYGDLSTGALLMGQPVFETFSNSAPLYQFYAESATADMVIGTANSSSATAKSDVELFRARGTRASPTIVQDGDYLGSLRFSGYDGSVFQTAAAIEGRVSGAASGGNVPTSIVFNTGVSGTGVERMWITDTGNVGIGSVAPDTLLHVYDAGDNPQIRLEGPGDSIGEIIFEENGQGDNFLMRYSGVDNNLTFVSTNVGTVMALGRERASVSIGGTTDTLDANDTNIPDGTLTIEDGALCADDGGTNCNDVSREAGSIYALGTGSILMPAGTTAQRPSGIDGMIRFNNTTDSYEVYSTTAGDWVAIVSAGTVSGGSSGADTQVIYNDSGALTGEAAFTYDQSNDTMTIASVSATDRLSLTPKTSVGTPNGLAINDLTDVNAGSATDGQVLTYDNASGNWLAQDAGSGSSLWTDLTGGRIHYGTTSANQVGVAMNNPAVSLDVGGTVRFGDGGETCGVTYEGALRYVSATSELQMCNGTDWVGIVNATGATGGGCTDSQTFSTPGEYSYTVDASNFGCTFKVRVYGAGGGGNAGGTGGAAEFDFTPAAMGDFELFVGETGVNNSSLPTLGGGGAGDPSSGDSGGGASAIGYDDGSFTLLMVSGGGSGDGTGSSGDGGSLNGCGGNGSAGAQGGCTNTGGATGGYVGGNGGSAGGNGSTANGNLGGSGVAKYLISGGGGGYSGDAGGGGGGYGGGEGGDSGGDAGGGGGGYVNSANVDNEIAITPLALGNNGRVEIVAISGTPTLPAGTTLNDLADTAVPSPSDGDVLTWDNSSSRWVGQAAGAGSSLWTDLTGGRIHYGTAGTEQIGIGMNNPAYTLDLNGDMHIADDGIIYYDNRELFSADVTNANIFLTMEDQFGSIVSDATGTDNVLMGYSTGISLTTGSANTFLGSNAGLYTDTADSNVFVGSQAGLGVGGNSNVIIGQRARGTNSYTADLNNSVIIGSYAGDGAEGDWNVILGSYAGTGATGDSNVFIGGGVGENSSTGERNILIGFDIELPTGTTSDYMSFGDVLTGDLSNSVVRVENDAGFPQFQLTSNNTTLPDYSSSSSVGSVSTSNVFGRLTNNLGTSGTATTGGMLVQGFTNGAENAGFPLDISGSHGGTAPTTPAVRISGQKHSGTDNRSAIGNNEILLDVVNNYDSATPLMRIMGDGDVGIGSASPASKLDLGAGSTGQRLLAWHDNNTKGGLGVDMTGDTWEFNIFGQANGTLGHQSFGFISSTDGTTYTEEMRLTEAGFLGIGNTSPDVELDVTGDIEYSGTITDVSDERLKESIEPLNKHGALLERIDQIETVSFVMKDDKDKRTEFGVIAQQLETVFPELVHTAKDELGTKSVNYVGLIAPMIEATKELKDENAALKTELETIRNEREDVKNAVADLTKQVDLLNKAANNKVEKASIIPLPQSWMLLLIGFLGGLCMVLVVTRKKHQAG